MIMIAIGMVTAAAVMIIFGVAYWYGTYGPDDYAARHRKIPEPAVVSAPPRRRPADRAVPKHARAAVTLPDLYPARTMTVVVPPAARTPQPVERLALEAVNPSAAPLASTGELRALAYAGDMDTIRSEIAAWKAMRQLEEWT